MRVAIPFAVSAIILSISPVIAQTVVDPANERADDVVLSPLSDVNLRKKAIPPVLLAAVDNPYAMSGLKSCSSFGAAITELDGSLGDDFDVVQEKTRDEKRGNGAGSLAKAVIGGLIPFRGVIREVSGANGQQRSWDRALYAGSVRRAFLKGIGQTKGCAYPARPATAKVVAKLTAKRDAELAAKKAKPVAGERTAGTPAADAMESPAKIKPVSTPKR